MILVTGATGTIGSHLVSSLLEQDAPVRVLVRNADKARAAFGDRVDIVSGDLRDASSVSVALKGVDRVFLNSPSLDGFIDLQRPLIDAANAAGVGHLVRLSVVGAAPDATTSYGRGHFVLDQHLKASTLSWTILQPNGFMQNLLSSAETIKAAPETIVMLVVLGLIDVVMISNLLIMVIIGGYETFISRMRLEGHPDQPEWLSHVNASVLKVKLATAIIGISSIHLLKTFINAQAYEPKVLIAQTVIHITFLVSALAIAAVDRMMPQARLHAARVATTEGERH